MTIKLTFIKTLLLVLIIFMSSTPEVILAQTVTYDGGTPSRPIAVTGLVVNGISYDLTISYNIIYPFSTSESGFPQGDVLLAGTLLRDLLNTQGIDSDPTIIITAGKTTGGGLLHSRI